MKAYKRYWFTYKDLHLYLFKSREDARNGGVPPSVAINLKGCEVTPDVNLADGRFNIKLEVPTEGIAHGSNTEMWVRCDNVSIFFNIDEKQGKKLINIICISILYTIYYINKKY